MTKIDLVNNRLIPNAIEPRAAIGDYDRAPKASHCTRPARIPTSPARARSLHRAGAEHKLRVIAPDVGGGFGSKIFIYAEES